MFTIEKYGWKRKDTEEYTLFHKDDDGIVCFSFLRINNKNGQVKIALNSEISLEELIEIYRTAKIIKGINSHEPVQV